MTLGQRITKRRKELRMSRDELAAITGISYTQLWRYEKGENDPSSAALLAIAKVLTISTDWLLGNTTTEEVTKTDLTPLEAEALAVFRSKPFRRQKAMIELLKIAD